MKTLKFKDHLVPLVLSGEKDSTWRLFDDKDLMAGDELILINKDSGEEFGKSVIVSTREKKLGELQDSDFSGHEKFESTEKMYETYKTYYGNRVTPETTVKIVKFKLIKLERNKAVPAVYLILKQDGKILLGRRANTGYHDGDYSLPSGHVEFSELPIHAIIREVKEEIGIDILPEDIRFVHFMYREKQDPTGDRVDIFFEAAKWTGEIRNNEPHKCDDVSWFPINSLPPNMIEHIRQVILSVERGEVYAELDGKDNFKTQ